MSLRILAGKWRGRALTMSAGKAVRPTASRVRESMFNLLTHHRILERLDHPGLTGARIADICAGCGALGFEALSRGAAHVTFVDQSRASLELVRKNAAMLEASDIHTVQCHAAQLPRVVEPFDTILMDPPYGKNLGIPILQSLLQQGWLAPHTLLLLETGSREPLNLPEPFNLVDSRTYGAATLHVIVTAHNI
ncbi:16S rRNA (guanine(966)-N(2))-methyltransferase RsmD [bacterium]|nr:16S rRNA (guanine(966)-N(2))-methyltransferase RsmD [bacterium]